MLLESIEYTATLIDYISKQTGMTVAEVSSAIGKNKIFDLCHNAPMNKYFSISKIAREVIYDNYLPSCGWSDEIAEDYNFGKQIRTLVDLSAADSHLYVDSLYELLLKD